MALEFPTLGKHCEAKGCRELDFLPFQCAHCDLIFCLEHRSQTSHSCPVAPLNVFAVECPVCGKEIDSKDDANAQMDHHLTYGCLGKGKPSPNMCEVPRCRKIEPVPFHCKKCNRQFCVAHRHAEHHSCSSLKEVGAQREAAEEKAASQAQHNSKLKALMKDRETRVYKSKKAQEQAEKIQQMKMKHEAQGSPNIPITNRFYLEVLYTSTNPRRLYFSDKWTVGKAIDEAAKVGRLANNNHIPNAEKLQLYCLKTGEPLPTSAPLKQLAQQGRLSNGDSVLLDYQSNIKVAG